MVLERGPASECRVAVKGHMQTPLETPLHPPQCSLHTSDDEKLEERESCILLGAPRDKHPGRRLGEAHCLVTRNEQDERQCQTIAFGKV